MFDFGNIRAAATAAVAAILLTAVTVGAAVGPARAVEADRPMLAAAALSGAAHG